MIQHWKQCRRCGYLTPNHQPNGGKCPVSLRDPSLRDYHEMENVRVEVTVLDDVIRPEFAARARSRQATNPRVSNCFIQRLECPECGISADTSLFPVAVRYHGKGCSGEHKPVLVRYYRERNVNA